MMTEKDNIIKGPWADSEVKNSRVQLQQLIQEIENLAQKAQNQDCFSSDFAINSCAIRMKAEEIWKIWQETQEKYDK